MDFGLTNLHLPQLSLSPPPYTGTTVDINQSASRRSFSHNALKSLVIGFLKTSASAFIIAGWTHSGPAAFDTSFSQAVPHFFHDRPVRRVHLKVTALNTCPCVINSFSPSLSCSQVSVSLTTSTSRVLNFKSGHLLSILATCAFTELATHPRRSFPVERKLHQLFRIYSRGPHSLG